jgi:hypothetical protein
MIFDRESNHEFSFDERSKINIDVDQEQKLM